MQMHDTLPKQKPIGSIGAWDCLGSELGRTLCSPRCMNSVPRDKMKAGRSGWLLAMAASDWLHRVALMIPNDSIMPKLWLEFPWVPPPRLIWCTIKDSRTASNRQQLSDILSTSLVWHIEVNPYKAVLTRQSSYLQRGNSWKLSCTVNAYGTWLHVNWRWCYHHLYIYI